MIAYPNGKINLGLRVTGKRPDGYHEIQSVFFPVPVFDILEMVPSVSGTPVFHQSGLPIPGLAENNLCNKALEVFQSAVGSPLSSYDIYLHKQIPMGSGLGGGSSDGAFVLRMLNEWSGSPFSVEQLEVMALELGSDCPFFIRNRPAFAQGRGDVLSGVDVDLDGFFLALIIPPVHVSTAEAYRMLTPALPETDLREIISLPVEDWKDNLINDFEEPVMGRFNEIREIKERLYALGAVYASMSGSGSAVFGLFENPVQISGSFPANYFTHISQL